MPVMKLNVAKKSFSKGLLRSRSSNIEIPSWVFKLLLKFAMIHSSSSKSIVMNIGSVEEEKSSLSRHCPRLAISKSEEMGPNSKDLKLFEAIQRRPSNKSIPRNRIACLVNV